MVAALAFLVWDVLTTLDDEVSQLCWVSSGRSLREMLGRYSTCGCMSSTAACNSQRLKIRNAPHRTRFQPLKVLYFFTRYYSVVVLMYVHFRLLPLAVLTPRQSHQYT